MLPPTISSIASIIFLCGVALVSCSGSTASISPSSTHGHPLRLQHRATAENRAQCINWEIPADSLVTGYFMVENAAQTYLGATAYIVTHGSNQPFTQNNLSGEAHFSFRSTNKVSTYQACVTMSPKPGSGGQQAFSKAKDLPIFVTIQLDWTVDLFDDSVAKKLKLDPLEEQFYALKEATKLYAQGLDTFVAQETKLRDTNESILNRVRYVAVIAIAVLIGLGFFQITYLKRFFKSKKLI